MFDVGVPRLELALLNGAQFGKAVYIYAGIEKFLQAGVFGAFDYNHLTFVCRQAT